MTLVAVSDSVSWLSVVIGGGAVLLGGIGAEGLNIWHEGRKAKRDIVEGQAALEREAAANFVLVTDRAIIGTVDGKPMTTDQRDEFLLAYTQLVLVASELVAMAAKRLGEVWSDIADMEDSEKLDGEIPEEMLTELSDSRKNFVAAVRKAQGLSDLPGVLSVSPKMPSTG
jgi:hypothetical protein